MPLRACHLGCPAQGSKLSYAELDKRANQLAHHLVALGVGPEVPVGVMMERSLDMFVALLAVLKAGGAYVPMDPSYPPDRLALMLDDSEVGWPGMPRHRALGLPKKHALTAHCLLGVQAPVLLSQEKVLARVDIPTEARRVLVRFFDSWLQCEPGPAYCAVACPECWGEPARTRQPHAPAQVDTQWPAIAQLPGTSPGARARDDSMCYIIFTSGSTGRPKGAVMQHNGVLNNLYSLASYALHPACS